MYPEKGQMRVYLGFSWSHDEYDALGLGVTRSRNQRHAPEDDDATHWLGDADVTLSGHADVTH